MVRGSVKTQELRELKVDELRSKLKKQGVTGVSSLRKDELVRKLSRKLNQGSKAKTGGAVKASSKQSNAKPVRYAQKISSTQERPERAGQSLTTTDHDVIMQWAQARNAVPATIAGTERENRVGMLRFDFPGGASGGNLRQISWNDWFRTFDERRLNFIYQEQLSSGNQSNFFQLENPGREDA